MAADKLDATWDSCIKVMSGSYEKTMNLLAEKKNAEAAKEFSQKFMPAMKELNAEAANTYPTRFEKAKDTWCEWMRQLNTYSRGVSAALTDGKQIEEAKNLLDKIREHFYTLHVKAETLKTNDYLYAFNTKAQAETPDIIELKKLCDQAQKADRSVKAKAENDAYCKLCGEWSNLVNAALQDGKLTTSELDKVRTETAKFYKAYGIQFE